MVARLPKGRLVAEGGQGPGTSIPLLLQCTLVGRIDSAHLVLDDPTVSRLHARVCVARGGVWVEDLLSRQGTWINGVAQRKAWLADGDRVAFGDAVFSYRSGSRGARAAGPARQ